MTGFGRASCESGGLRMVVTARSVNHRGLSIAVSMPAQLAPLEEAVRSAVRNRISRGRIDLSVTIEEPEMPERQIVDLDRARSVLAASRAVAEELGLPGGLSLAEILSFPGVVKREGQGAAVPDEAGLLACLDACLDDLCRSRAAEGEIITGILLERIAKIGSLLAPLAEGCRERLQERFSRTRERVERLAGDLGLDEARLAMEVALLAERMDVSEETERMRSHLAASAALLEERSDDAGRKLSFLVLEMQRELSTMAAKLEDAADVMTVVEMKNELASIKEQVANVE
ncbi:YicC family protein [Candidatus Fermentibacteria bacterium]|nr:YicC family protein [Candidatus Fermentibacteria bacterium]